MTWVVVLSIIVTSVFKLVVSSMPTTVVKWFVTRFQLHPEVVTEQAVVMIDGEAVEGQEKTQIVEQFNEALFIKQYYIYPGTEAKYLNPNDAGTPVVIQTKQGKTDVTLSLYTYDDHVHVVKNKKKKTIAYCVRSQDLQSRAFVATEALI